MIKPFITKQQKTEYYYKDVYLCTTDLDQKRTHKFEAESGETLELLIPTETVLNHRIAHPNYGKIAYASEGAQFQVGDTIIARHFTFENEDFKPQIFYTEDGVDYFKVINFDVLFAVRDKGLVPREGILLCEGVEGKLVQTDLEVGVDYEGRRRDLVKVLKVWEGCTDYKAGDYLLIRKGGDYAFTHEGKEYLKVDHYFQDVMAIVPSPEWGLTEVRTHVRDYNERKQF